MTKSRLDAVFIDTAARAMLCDYDIHVEVGWYGVDDDLVPQTVSFADQAACQKACDEQNGCR